MKKISIFERVGADAENKDIGREIRLKEILPLLERNEEIILDFEGVQTASQSFIHSLISDAMRTYKNDALDRIIFKSCNDSIQQMINIVVEYMQDALAKERQEGKR